MHMVQTVKEGQTAQDEGITLALVACKHTIYRGARARPLRPWLMGLQVRQRPAAGTNASTRAVACIAQGARAAGVCVPWFVQTDGSRDAEQVDVKGSTHAASCTGASCGANPACPCTSSAAVPPRSHSSHRSALQCQCCPPQRTRSRAVPQCQRRSVPAAQAAAPASAPPEGPAPRRPAGEWKVQQRLNRLRGKKAIKGSASSRSPAPWRPAGNLPWLLILRETCRATGAQCAIPSVRFRLQLALDRTGCAKVAEGCAQQVERLCCIAAISIACPNPQPARQADLQPHARPRHAAHSYEPPCGGHKVGGCHNHQGTADHHTSGTLLGSRRSSQKQVMPLKSLSQLQARRGSSRAWRKLVSRAPARHLFQAHLRPLRGPGTCERCAWGRQAQPSAPPRAPSTPLQAGQQNQGHMSNRIKGT